jgi:hypothetical protein
MNKINTLIVVALAAIVTGCATGSTTTVTSNDAGKKGYAVRSKGANPDSSKASSTPTPADNGQKNWSSDQLTADEIAYLRGLRSQSQAQQAPAPSPSPAPQSSGNGYSWGSSPYSWGSSSGGQPNQTLDAGRYAARMNNGQLEIAVPDRRGVVEEDKNYVTSRTHTRTRVVNGYVTELGGNELPPVPPEHVFEFHDGSSGRTVRKYSHGNSSAMLQYDPVTDKTTITESINSYESETNQKPVVYTRRYQLGDGFNSRNGQFQRDPEPGRLLNTLKGN